MKKFIKTVFWILIIFNSFANYAQERALIRAGLTPEQQELLKSQRELMAHNREKFRATLTPEQINILESKDLTPKAQHDALMASLNDAQRALVFENISKAKQIKEEFRNTLSEEQKNRLRRLNDDRHRESIRENRRNLLLKK